MRITKKQLRNLIQEAMPAGGVPDMVGYLNKGRPDPIVDAMIDDYEDFVEREGHVTRASSSVAASFFMQDPERRDDHDAHQQLADAIGLDHDDIMRDMERQKREQGAMAESRRLVETQISYDDAADTATHRSAGGSPQVFTRDDYYDMISDFSKELTGRRGTYYRPDQLDTMDIQGVAEYYEDMFDSEEARQVNASFEAEMQKQADEEIGMEKDQPALNKAPKSQGMGRRMENVMKVTKRQLRRIIKEEKARILLEDKFDDVTNAALEIFPDAMVDEDPDDPNGLIIDTGATDAEVEARASEWLAKFPDGEAMEGGLISVTAARSQGGASTPLKDQEAAMKAWASKSQAEKDAHARNASWETMAWKRYRKHAQENGLSFDPDNPEDMEVARAWWSQQPESKQFEGTMNITKNQLRRIIKEEKQKLLVEMNPMANAERSLGMYANVSLVDQLSSTVMELLQNIETEAVEDGLDDEEAEDYAADATVLAVAQAFQAAGLVAEYEALVRTLGR